MPTKKKSTKAKTKKSIGSGHDAYLKSYDRRKIDKASSRMRLVQGRQEGTAAFKRVTQAVNYIKKNPRATVKDVISNTDYSMSDLRWDLNAEHATLVK